MSFLLDIYVQGDKCHGTLSSHTQPHPMIEYPVEKVALRHWCRSTVELLVIDAAQPYLPAAFRLLRDMSRLIACNMQRFIHSRTKEAGREHSSNLVGVIRNSLVLFSFMLNVLRILYLLHSRIFIVISTSRYVIELSYCL